MLEQLYRNHTEDRSPGLMRGVVKENWDEAYPGMVKVEFSAGEPGYMETSWVPVASIYAGNGCGSYWLPETGTHVIVGFFEKCWELPVVLGCLWGAADDIPEGCAAEGNPKKMWKTAGGHEIMLDDEEEKLVVTCGEIQIELDGRSGELSIQADKVTITAKEYAATGSSSLEIESGGDLKLKAKGGLKAEATAAAEIKGSMIKLN